MKYFNSDFAIFFDELKNNNNKEWFHEQKKRYESSVKTPFYLLVQDLIDEIRLHDSTLLIDPKDCVLRINKDIRFSKDKTPYNTHVTAFISSGGKKDKSIPGLFIRLTSDNIGIMGGCYGPSKEQLLAVRLAIQENPNSLLNLTKEDKFVKAFGEIKGEQAKRVPREFKESSAKYPILLNKQFYFSTEREQNLITSDHLKEELMKYWHIANPINNYLYSLIK